MGSKENKEKIKSGFRILDPNFTNRKKLTAQIINVCKFIFKNTMTYEDIAKFRMECFRLATNNCLIDDDTEVIQHIVQKNAVFVSLPVSHEIQYSVIDVIKKNPNSWLLIYFDRDGSLDFPICVDTSKSIIYDALNMKSEELDSKVLYYYKNEL